MAPRTPSPDSRPRRRQEADTIRKTRFFHAVDRARKSNKSMIKVFEEEDINRNTGYYWLRQRQNLGSSAHRRLGKARSGRPRKITEEHLQRLLDPAANSVRDQVLKCQLAYHQLSYSLRTLQRTCVNHKSRIRMFKRPKVKKLRSKNKKDRVQYGTEHQSEIVKSLWQFVSFTDEAHVDSGQIHRSCILRQEGTRLHSDNMQEMPDLQGVKLHMAASVS